MAHGLTCTTRAQCVLYRCTKTCCLPAARWSRRVVSALVSTSAYHPRRSNALFLGRRLAVVLRLAKQHDLDDSKDIDVLPKQNAVPLGRTHMSADKTCESTTAPSLKASTYRPQWRTS
eukprot:3868750-Amphidinium_carterae.1